MTRKRILLCEDNFILRKSLESLLDACGFVVLDFDSADGAMELGMEALIEFDVLLTDYEMPGTNGLDLARRLRSLSSGLSIFLMSGHAIATGHLQEISARFFPKPFLPSQLIKAIHDSQEIGSSAQRAQDVYVNVGRGVGPGSNIYVT